MALPFAKARADAMPEVQYMFPYVSWKHGKQAFEAIGGIAYTGGFMLGSDSYDENTKIPGWKEEQVPVKKGKISALCANPAYITILRYREKWETAENGKQHSNLHAVGLIRGYDEMVCFQASGYATSEIKAAIREHQKVANVANKSRPQGTPPMPPYLFWMKIQGGKHKMNGEGANVSEATPPTLALPASLTLEYAEKAFVGEDLMEYLQEQYVILEPWQKQWPASRRDDDSQITEDSSKRDQADSVQAPRSMAAGASGGYDGDMPGELRDDSGIPF